MRDRADPERVWRSDLARPDVGLAVSDRRTSCCRRHLGDRAGDRPAAGAEAGTPFLLGRDRRLECARAARASWAGAAVEVGVLDADDIAATARSIGEAFERRRRVRRGRARGRRARRPGGSRRRPRRGGRGDARQLPRRRLAAARVPAPAASAGRGDAGRALDVAAERPRACNAIYGAAKAGLDALAQGLADATRRAACACSSSAPGSSRPA